MDPVRLCLTANLRPSLAGLRALEAAERRRGFTQAAEELHVTHSQLPPVSRYPVEKRSPVIADRFVKARQGVVVYSCVFVYDYTHEQRGPRQANQGDGVDSGPYRRFTPAVQAPGEARQSDGATSQKRSADRYRAKHS
jgi:hypothetical protein